LEVHVLWVTRGVDDANDLFSLAFNSEGSDGVDQLFAWDVATAVIVEDVEALLKLEDGFLGEFSFDVLFGVEGLI
jgi:hypothetical protein